MHCSETKMMRNSKQTQSVHRINTPFKRIPMFPFWSLDFFPLIYFSLRSHCFHAHIFNLHCFGWYAIRCIHTILRKKLFNFCFVGMRLETHNLLWRIPYNFSEIISYMKLRIPATTRHGKNANEQNE